MASSAPPRADTFVASPALLTGLEPVELPADAVEVGRIGDAWGIKGWFRVLPYSATPEALFSSRRWFIQPTERGAKTFTGTRKLAIKEAKEHSDSVVATAHDIPDRDTAEALKGARVFVARSSFPSTTEDEFYWVDLIGLDVVNREGLAMGRVKELLSTGPQTVMVLAFEAEGKPQERMIPFVAAFVDGVDLVVRRITVDWQPDY
ncbi:ribosome maturation factor RimM [Xylophilus ampelinus]|uniref:Ribosome maturation factor RimM n=1 Tax=Xylophilus ampelinus TaxID=54067 RepID=A0A318SQN3_9BURK|nr:ribosome maturation factor RimM [Xylophilus ampelinus]MCS4511462.1 ribosome maturation factor RimM [Xylophilus ampelinus]PYE74840.1 16S rRNA processing protein RimM [Xylophilus ampelinus]